MATSIEDMSISSLITSWIAARRMISAPALSASPLPNRRLKTGSKLRNAEKEGLSMNSCAMNLRNFLTTASVLCAAACGWLFISNARRSSRTSNRSIVIDLTLSVFMDDAELHRSWFAASRMSFLRRTKEPCNTLILLVSGSSSESDSVRLTGAFVIALDAACG